MGKIKLPSFNGALGLGLAHGIRAWMSTLRYEAVFEDRLVDPALRRGGPRVYVVWHENMLAPIYLRPGCDIAILVSQHRDADMLETVARCSGLTCVRGSTRRGGAAALRELTRRGREQHIVITPDGPRGPRRRLSLGPIYLAAKLGRPLVPIAVAYDRCWRTRSWDRFAVPRPFTTARVVMGEEITVSGSVDREAIERSRLMVQERFDRLTDEAEAWASTGRIGRPAERGRRQSAADSPGEPPRRLAA